MPDDQTQTPRDSHQPRSGATIADVGNQEADRLMAEAARLMAQAQALKSGDGGPTVRELVEAYEAERATLRPPSWHTIVGLHRHIVKHLGDLRPMDLTRPRLQRYLNERLREKSRYGRPPSNQTCNHELTRLQAVCNWAVDSRLIPSNPIRKRPHLPVDQRQHPEWGERELQRLLSASPSDAFAVLVFLRWLTGARPGEALRLEWTSVDFENCTIRFPGPTTKTRHTRSVAMEDRLVRTLRTYRKSLPEGSRYLFASYTGRPYSVSHAYRLWRRMVRDSGLERENDHLTFHDVRALWTGMARRRGVDVANRTAQLGHVTLETQSPYEFAGNAERQRVALQMEMGAAAEMRHGPARAEVRPSFGRVRTRHSHQPRQP